MTVDEAATKPPKSVTVVVAVAPRCVTDASVSVSAVTGQFVPFARHTPWPITVAVVNVPTFAKRLVVDAIVAKRFVVVTETPVAFTNVKFVSDDETEVSDVSVVGPVIFRLVPVAPLKRRFVAKRFVLVVFVPVALVQVRFVALKFETVRFVNPPFVAKRLVAVAFTEVVLPKFAFHLNDAFPSEYVRSAAGFRLEFTEPETERAVVVTFVPVPFAKVTFWRVV